jgi:hypothetical protein
MPPRRRHAAGTAPIGSAAPQVETFVLDQSAIELSNEMCNKLEADGDLDVTSLAREHHPCPFQHPDSMKSFCSTLLMKMIGTKDSRRGQYARLACQLMIVWNNPIVVNGQEDSFVRRLHEVTQDAFESMNCNDKTAARGFAVTLGELYKANVISQRVLGQVMGTLLNDERHGGDKVEWACHIVDACSTALPGSFVEPFLEKFETLLKEEGQPLDAQTKTIATLTVDKLKKLKEEKSKVRPLSEAYTDLYADLHSVKSKILGETTSLLQKELDELRDAVDGTGEQLEETFQQRLRSSEDVLRDLNTELVALRQETSYLEQEVAARDELDKFCEYCLELNKGCLEVNVRVILQFTIQVSLHLNALGKPHGESLAILAKSLNTTFTEQLSKECVEIEKKLSPCTEAMNLLKDLLGCLQARR